MFIGVVMTIKLGQEETKFNKENLIKENDTRFSEIIDFLKKDCKAEFINNKWTWVGNYEVKGKDKFTYILNTFRLNKNNEEEFEIIVSSKNIKMYFYFTKDELINKFFSATKTLSLIVELKDIEEDGKIVDTLARWKVDYRITLRELAFLKRAIEAEMIRRNQNV